ncbi:thioesterase family protein, partial [Chloroflexota bacterium]
GNLETGTIHGGAISAMLDITGGLAVFRKLRKDMQELSLEDQMKRLSKVKTIDMRVDYLRPPKGNEFIGTASILRTGNKVAVTRMELHNDDEKLIAVGTGTYIVG